ncbi:MAG: ribosome silencing factor [Deltaproteobacteria bacterium]|nr:ribosome silencing factor [Deltaproteobacteria bacterium]
MQSKKLLENLIELAEETKAVDLVQVDFEGKGILADYMLICHGTSSTHVRGIVDKIELGIKKQKILPLGIEGYTEASWVLMDYNDVIVHVFLEETRNIYQLEELFEQYPSKHLS